jgi:propionate CoA-transferase
VSPAGSEPRAANRPSTTGAGKIVTAEEAVRLVPTGATIVVDGSGGGVNEPDLLLSALEQRYLRDGEPRDLTVVHPNGLGDGNGSGIDRLAHPGLIRRVVGGHWGWSRRMQELALADAIEAYCLPQGTLSHLLREIAGGRPGVLTTVGLGTFVDPRLGGGRLNARSVEDIVHAVTLADREWLFVPAVPVDVAIIRATVADEFGNLVMDEEGLAAEWLPAAQAAKNSGGVVLAQAKYAVRADSLDPRRVRVPGVLVDAVCLAPDQQLSRLTPHHPGLTGALRTRTQASGRRRPLTLREIVARRAAHELRQGDVVNIGYGMADGIVSVLDEEGQADGVVLTLEQGHIGGRPETGSNFGLAQNPQASLDAAAQFDWYDGGGLDIACLSFAEVDAAGDVNVSRFGGRVPGVGGFMNITTGASRLVFVGSFTAGATVDCVDGTLRVCDDGAVVKFVRTVEQISFSAAQARRRGQSVTYITERAVFGLADDGLVVTELAPGVDLDRDVLARMAFRPAISRDLRRSAAALYQDGPMGLALLRPEKRSRS